MSAWLDLGAWREQGLLSALDYRFAQAMGRLAGESRAEILAALALVSRMTRDGHVCLDLGVFCARPVIIDAEARPIALTSLPPLNRWLAMVRSSALVGEPGTSEPLVLEASRLYLRRYFRYEKRLARALVALTGARALAVADAALERSLSELFPGGDTDRPDLQRLAAETAVRRQLCIITGGPGTGKTSTVVKILALLFEQAELAHQRPPRVTLLAPTGKGAARLTESIARAKRSLPGRFPFKEQLPEGATTIHRCLAAAARRARSREGAPALLETDFVLVDEASMVDLELMAKLFAIIPATARAVLLGDRDQLFSVEAGAVLGDICDAVARPTVASSHHPLAQSVVTLSRPYRYTSTSGIARLASAIKRGAVDEALGLLAAKEIPEIELVQPAKKSGIEPSLRDAVRSGYTPFIQARELGDKLAALGGFRVLCAHRHGWFGAARLNQWIGSIIADRASGAAGPVVIPITVTRNDYRLELYNGDLGLLLSDPSGADQDRAVFIGTDGTERRFAPAELGEYEIAFAMSIHKSQGSEFDRVIVMLPDQLSPVLTRELLYTAVTRARSALTIYGSASIIEQAIGRQVVRASGLGEALVTVALATG
jgi:exodeoxyribonuclease V alpha subunit